VKNKFHESICAEGMSKNMENTFGKPLMERESDMKGVFLKRAILAFVGLGCLAGSVYMAFFGETEAVWASIVIAVVLAVLGLVILGVSLTIEKQRAIIYEEGVFVANGDNEHYLHFGDIVGLSDEPGGGMTIRGGLVQVLVASAVVTAAGKIADAHNRKHRIRPINIWAKIDGELKSLSVIKSAGDVLSQLYTEWLIAQKSISAENLHSLTLPFAEKLELNQGTFNFTDASGNKATLNLADMADISWDEQNFHLRTADEYGEPESVIKLPIGELYNFDLLLYIHDLQDSIYSDTP